MREYGFSTRVLHDRSMPLSTVAACAAHLPRGSAVYRWFGGWAAVSEESHLLSHLIWQHQAANAKKKPEYPKPPAGERDVQARADAVQARRADKVRALKLMGQKMRGVDSDA